MNKMKLCKICGDTGTGFNYNVLSCESCKVFFHRNSGNLNKFICAHNENCLINVYSRRKCSKCRLEKCFKLGMQRNCEINLRKSEQIVHKKKDVIHLMVENILLFDPIINLKNDHYNLGLNLNGKLNRKHANKLNAYESEKLYFILNALRLFIEENQATIIQPIEDVYEGFGRPEIYAKNAVTFCKRMDAFNCLNSKDQLAVLKTFCYDLITLRFAFYYDSQKRGSPSLVDEVETRSIFITFDAFNNDSYFSKYQKQIDNNVKSMFSLNVAMENDTQIRDLITTILLFKKFKTTSNPEFVKYNHVMYAKLLQRYLENKYQNKNKAHIKYRKIMIILKELDTIKENEIVIFQDCDRQLMPAFYVELMDF